MASIAFPQDVIDGAARRWRDRQAERHEREEAIRSGRITDVESPDRIQRRLTRLSTISRRARPPASAAALPHLVETIGLERVLGRSDFLGMQFIELSLAVSRFTGRVHIRQRPGRTAGFGTGFMVSPRLLLTNNHVLPSPEFAANSEIEFDFQNDRRGRPLPVVVYGFDPASFFLSDATLDYTLVAVRQTSVNGTDLKLYGWNRLDAQQGKALIGDALNIIQHPKGEPKQIVLRANQLVDLLDTFAHYVTDTEPGSSGSPVYNDQWEVVALHHSGVPKTDADGNLIAKDGSVWTTGMEPELLDWVANEGIRVNSLIAHISSQPLRMTPRVSCAQRCSSASHQIPWKPPRWPPRQPRRPSPPRRAITLLLPS
jgi:V8-like Glu-specific endopeptidase